MDGLWATKSEGVGLIVRAFISRSYYYTVWSAIGSSLLSVCLSVRLSVTLCILTLRVGIRG